MHGCSYSRSMQCIIWVQQRINIFIHYNGSSSFCPNLWERELWKPSVALISPRYWNVLFHSAAIMPILFTLLITQMSNFPFVIVLKDFSVVPLTYMSTELIHVFLWFLYWCSVQGSKPHPPFSMSGSVEPLSPMIPIEQFWFPGPVSNGFWMLKWNQHWKNQFVTEIN